MQCNEKKINARSRMLNCYVSPGIGKIIFDHNDIVKVNQVLAKQKVCYKTYFIEVLQNRRKCTTWRTPVSRKVNANHFFSVQCTIGLHLRAVGFNQGSFDQIHDSDDNKITVKKQYSYVRDVQSNTVPYRNCGLIME